MALAPYNMPFSSLDPALRPVAGALPVMVARRLNHAVTLFAGVVFMIGAASAVFAGSVPLLAHAAKDRDATTVSVLLTSEATAVVSGVILARLLLSNELSNA